MAKPKKTTRAVNSPTSYLFELVGESSSYSFSANPPRYSDDVYGEHLHLDFHRAGQVR